MRLISHVWSNIHHDERGGFLRSPLSFLSSFYSRGVGLRLWAYRNGILKNNTLPEFVISLGNLTVGGTGKTPAVEMLAKWALAQGYRPAVLSKGYGGHFKGNVLEVSDGAKIKTVPRVSGDEPYLLAKNLPGIPVIVSRARYKGGLWACEKFSSNFLILDDGFQHLELNRDLNILLLDASDPFGNGFSLPRGPLREPVAQLGRADVCIITRYGKDKRRDKAVGLLETRFPNLPFFLSDHIPARLVFPITGKVKDPHTLEGKRVIGFAGIARPGSFEQTLRELGAELVHFEAFGDHHHYTSAEITELLERRRALGADYVMTTSKDWVKLEPESIRDGKIGYIGIEFTLLKEQGAFFKLVRKAFEEKSQRICPMT